jgi:hypothetical protein
MNLGLILIIQPHPQAHDLSLIDLIDLTDLHLYLLLHLALREQREALAARSQWDDGLTPSRGIRCQ